VGQLCKLRADFIGALRGALLSRKKPVENRLQDEILPHNSSRLPYMQAHDAAGYPFERY